MGGEHIETALVLNSIGVLGKYNGEYALAKRVYERALRIAKSNKYRWLTATLYHNLGGLFHERRKYTRAAPYARQAVKLREKLLGKSHPDVIADLGAYAAVLQGQRRYGPALRIYERALKFYERRRDEYEIAVTEHNLGVLKYALKRRDEAKKHMLRSLSLKRKLLGRHHSDYAFTLCSLGVLYKRLGEKAQARKALGQALNALRRSLGKSHPNVKFCKKHLSSL